LQEVGLTGRTRLEAVPFPVVLKQKKTALRRGLLLAELARGWDAASGLAQIFLEGVIPKSRAFTSGTRDLARSAAGLRRFPQDPSLG